MRPVPLSGVVQRRSLLAVLLLAAFVVSACTVGSGVPDAGNRTPLLSRTAGQHRSRASQVVKWFPRACRRIIDPGVTTAVLAGGVEPLLPPKLPPIGNPQWVWRPTEALPPPARPGQYIDVVLTPHPDDETLSMSVLISRWHRRGDRVILVALTNGEGTGSWIHIDQLLHVPVVAPAYLDAGDRSVTRFELTYSRLAELSGAATALGVAPGDLFFAHLDDLGTDHARNITVLEVLQVIKAMAARYPHATFLTMSYLAERHPDHLAAGEALCDAVRTGLVKHAVWAVSRLYWGFPTAVPPTCLPVAPVDRHAVNRALSSYETWNPAAGRLAVGYQSVEPQFDAMHQDERNCFMTSRGTALAPA